MRRARSVVIVATILLVAVVFPGFVRADGGMLEAGQTETIDTGRLWGLKSLCTTNLEERMDESLNKTKHMGTLLLGIWLIVTGLLLVVMIPTPNTARPEA
jgi:hypothetical protein